MLNYEKILSKLYTGNLYNVPTDEHLFADYCKKAHPAIACLPTSLEDVNGFTVLFVKTPNLEIASMILNAAGHIKYMDTVHRFL